METAAFYADISPLENDEVFASQLASVPEARRKKVLQMKRPEDKRLSLGVSLLLRRALEINGVSLFSCRFAHTPEGKPYVVDFPVKISLSHSGKFAAVALSENEVGVDIERTEPQQRRLAERFFHPEEISYLAPFDGDEFDRRFTEIWTRKEAYVKALGTGIDSSFPTFSSLGDLSPVKITTFYLENEYYLSVAGSPCTSVRKLTI